MYVNWAAREEPFKKPLTCSREGELATLRSRHFVSPGVKKPSWIAPARTFSFIWRTFTTADQHRAPKFRFAWYVRTELTNLPRKYVVRFGALCTLMYSLHDRLVSATEQLVYMASRHFEKWPGLIDGRSNRCDIMPNVNLISRKNTSRHDLVVRSAYNLTVIQFIPPHAAKTAACFVHQPAALAPTSS